MRTRTEKIRRRFWLGLVAVLAMLGSLTFGKLTARAEVDGITWTVDGDTVIITGTGERTSWDQDLIDREVLASVKHVKFENCKLIGSANYLFSYLKDKFFVGYENLESIDVSGLDTSQVTSMSNMFFRCPNLTSLDLRGWNTSNVTDMYGMFLDCSGLTSLDLRGWNTSNITSMGYMFSGCSGLTDLDLRGWNTSNVMYMYSMFSGCSGLTDLDLSGFDTSNVYSMYAMFFDCSNLTNLNLSGFDTSNVESMYVMFFDCSNLTSIKTPKKMGNRSADLADLPYTFTSTEGVQTKVLSSEFANTVLTKGTEPAPFPDIRPNPDPTPTPDPTPSPDPAPVSQPVYRLYNPNSGEHLYTTDANETRTLSTIGWIYEGTAWSAPQTGVGVYRLYSPVTKMHLYTSDVNEVNVLVASTAWQLDNDGKPLFYTCEDNAAGRISIYRLYNEQAQMHLLTTSLNEYNTLGGIGWNREGEKLSCLALGDPNAPLP